MQGPLITEVLDLRTSYKKTKAKVTCHNLSYRIFSKDLVSYNIKGQPPLNGLLMIALPRPLMSCWLIILPPSHSQQRPAQPALPLFCLPKVAARIVAQDPLLKSPKECNEMENGSITFKWKPISATCWSSVSYCFSNHLTLSSTPVPF